MLQNLNQNLEKINAEVKSLKSHFLNSGSEPHAAIHRIENLLNASIGLIELPLENAIVKELKEKKIRSSDLAISQLSFFNNLFILMGTGILGFIFKDQTMPKLRLSISAPELDPSLIGVSLLSFVISITAGIICALNRFLVFVHTDRKYTYLIKYNNNTPTANNEAVNFPWIYWFKRPKIYELESEKTFNQLDIIIQKLRRYTARFLNYQVIFFITAIVLFAIYKVF